MFAGLELLVLVELVRLPLQRLFSVEYPTATNYEASCFISNWRTKAMEQPNALVFLQNELIRGIFKDKVKPVNDVDEGMDVIRSKIQSKRLLLILDDADQTNLISAWAGERYSFHPGSRIIIVSKDVEVLGKNKVYEREICQLQKLSEDEFVELFNFYAFGRDQPHKQYQEMSKRIASSVGGLPLNLKVFGSFFSDCRNISRWEEVLEKLTFHGNAQEDSIQSTNLGQNVGPIAEQAFGSTSSPSRDGESRQNLETPMRPSMAPDSSSNRDANTGRTLDPTGGPTSDGDYDSDRNPDDPDRLEKIIDKLDATAREIFLDIACFFIGMNRENAMHIWRGCEFSGGTNPDKAIQELLRVQLVSINIKDDTFYMDEKTKEMGRKMVEREDEELGRRSRLWEHEKSLHAMQWMKSLTCSSSAKEVRCASNCVTVRSYTRDRFLMWNLYFNEQDFENLKVLELKSSENQTAFPDLSSFPCLVKLTLDDCCRLAEVRTSIERQRELTYLKIRNCSILQSLPANFSSLLSFKILDLSGCSSLSDLPGEVGNLQSLMELLLSGTSVKVIPDSINQLRKLERLLLDNCKALTKLPGSLEGLKSLQELNAKKCTLLATLPTSIVNVSNLTHLLLDGTKIEELPSSLTKLLCYDCTALERLEDVSNLENLIELNLTGCTRLVEINGIDSLAALRRFHMSGCRRLSNASRNQLVQKIFEHLESFSILGGEIPNAFTNRQLSYEVPVSLDVREGMELLLCLVVAVEEQAGCWEPNIKVETEAEGEKIVKLPGVALSSKDDNLCLWHYKEADRVFPRGNVKITLVHHEWIKDEVRNGGLCEPEREVEAANQDGQQASVFECIARCCRTSNTA
ncbi:disease resistance protein RUN1-like [Nymphaea colorata]|nr:disease resistance protein RUN1-like [Nymphaea colorata]